MSLSLGKSGFLVHATIRRRTLRRGKHRLLLWADQEADGSVESRTPSKIGLKDEMGRLEKVGRTKAEDMNGG